MRIQTMKKTASILFAAIFSLLITSAAIAQSSNSGKENEPALTVIKYSDYQCPACEHYFHLEHQLSEELGDKVKFVTKHFPLNMHQHAQLASRAAEAARVQGKYQEMHEMLFHGQQQWSGGNAQAIFISYASSMGLDVNKFKKDLNSAEMQRIVMADRREGMQLNVNSTPTFFIDGQQLEGVPYNSYEAFKAFMMSYMKNNDES